MNSFFYSQEMPFFAPISVVFTGVLRIFMANKLANKKSRWLIDHSPLCKYDKFHFDNGYHSQNWTAANDSIG